MFTVEFIGQTPLGALKTLHESLLDMDIFGVALWTLAFLHFGL